MKGIKEMKHVLSLYAVIIIAISLLSGCSWLKDWKEKYIVDANNGIILYGNERQIQKSIDKHKSKLIFSETFKIKLVTFNKQRIMVLKKNTMKFLDDNGLINNKNKHKKAEVATVKSEMNSPKGILYGKNRFNELTINDQNIHCRYGGNKVIGHARLYSDMLLIVDDSLWNTINGKEKTVGVLKFKDKPFKSRNQYDAERGQLVKIK